jgi:hypothetical protein
VCSFATAIMWARAGWPVRLISLRMSGVSWTKSVARAGLVLAQTAVVAWRRSANSPAGLEGHTHVKRFVINCVGDGSKVPPRREQPVSVVCHTASQGDRAVSGSRWRSLWVLRTRRHAWRTLGAWWWGGFVAVLITRR